MFSSRNDNNATAYPAVPDSLQPNSYEMNDALKASAPRPDTAPVLTPYLGLRARLSQIWLNRWTILLLLVLVRVILLIIDLDDNIGDAKTQALSACTKVEDIGSAMASMPHYLSVGVNDMAATGIEKAVEAMVEMFDLVLVGVQQIILFYINFLVGTYVCLITGLVHSSLDVVANVTESATDLFNEVVNKTVGEIESISSDLTDELNKVAKDIENSVLGTIVPDLPTINFTEPIEALQGFNLSADDFVKDVQALNEDLPTFSQVENMTAQVIAFPFNLIRDALNETYGGYTFNKSAFPVAEKQSLTFCSDNQTINDFFTHLYELVHKAKIIFIVLLSLAAIIAMAPMAWLEIRRWHRQQRHAKLIAQNQFDPMDVLYIASRPMTATWGIKIASRFKGQKQILVRWCIAYATSTPAVLVLSLALAGFFSCLCQLILIKAVEKEVPALADQVGNFADEVVDTLKNVSVNWANDANGVVTNLNNEINDDLLGYVANATGAVNDTLNTFLDLMEEGLEDAFNGTILLDPIRTVVHCVIGIKIEEVQKGLTWVHDHAEINLPLFNNDTFSVGANDSITGDSSLTSFLSSPSDVTTDEVTGAVQHVVTWLHKNLIQDALTSMALMLVYIIVILFGVARTLAGMAQPERSRGEGGNRYTGDDRPALSPRVGHAQFEHDGPPPPFPHHESSSAEIVSSVSSDGAADVQHEKVMSGGRGVLPPDMQPHAMSSEYGHFEYDQKF